MKVVMLVVRLVAKKVESMVDWMVVHLVAKKVDLMVLNLVGRME